MLERLPVPGGAESTTGTTAALVRKLKALTLPKLAEMYLPADKSFVFRVRLTPRGVIKEGNSTRYTAITLIGLAEEGDMTRATVVGRDSLQDICDRLVKGVGAITNLGDLALTLWATQAVGGIDRTAVRQRLVDSRPAEDRYPTVEVSWALAALCYDGEATTAGLRDQLAKRLMQSCPSPKNVFPHLLGDGKSGLRSHVSCFADLVYPVHALAHYAAITNSEEAIASASHCAQVFCRQQGPEGQWWWHYHQQTGDVIEPYPVYAVHQDAMAPMALFALGDVTGHDFSSYIEKGLAWLTKAPELGDGSLIDEDMSIIWRKVARREPRKMTRALQTLASRLHPRLRTPGVNVLFPAGAVDYEDRPYHLGWLCYAWSPKRLAQWDKRR
ncbi:MAG: hypothetical protein AB7G75_14955 [Candidatus Binatia bacterium]